MTVPYEAREAGLAALNNDKDWHKPDGTGVWRANYHRAVDLVLEAAQPYMGVRPVVDREELIRALPPLAGGEFSQVADAVMDLLAGGGSEVTHEP